MLKLPEKYTERMKALLGSEFNDHINSLCLPPVKGFHVNTDKISLSHFEVLNIFGNEGLPFSDSGYYLNYDGAGNHPYHHAGMLYIQEPAAMIPAECLEIKPDWHILDMCAAPGGKSSQLKNKLGKNGVLVSNEIIPSRCKILTGNIERLGLTSTVVTCMDTSRLALTFPKCFDMIAVDAPCSGEGMFRKEAAAVESWSEENVKACAQRQNEILENAVKLLKNGGYIVYSTCTFSLEENEMTVDSFLSRHPEFELIPVTERVRAVTSDGILFDGCKEKNMHYARRCYPHKMRGEGQFAAVLHSRLEAESDSRYAVATKEAVPKAVTDFLNDLLKSPDIGGVKMYNGRPVIFGADFEVKPGEAFSYGITVGELKGGYIKPHHQLFSCLGKEFRRKIELTADSEALKKYLHGEEISADCPDGWAAVLVDGCPVGGAKAVKGVAKNHYPKGLRLKF